MPQSRVYDEDLFKDSTMTFGEHLDELRKCLFRAVLALAIGFGLGLLLSYWVVDQIKSPLEGALAEYYGDRTIERFKGTLEAMRAEGQTIPPEMDDDEAIRKLIFTDGLLFEERFINVRQLLEEVKRQHPVEWGSLRIPESAEVNTPLMTRLFLWHKASDDERLRIRTLNAPEPFMIYIKAALLSGAVLSSPFVFYFIWSFVAAGLYPHEKRYVHIFLPFSLGLFVLGVLVAFTFVFPPVLRFFFSFNHAFNVDPDPRLSEWLGFVLMLPIAFGVSFQLPLVMMFLERIGIFSVKSYISKWRIAVLTIAILSMVLSPGGDPYSMMLMMVPLVFLYFGGIGLCKWMPRNTSYALPVAAAPKAAVAPSSKSAKGTDSSVPASNGASAPSSPTPAPTADRASPQETPSASSASTDASNSPPATDAPAAPASDSSTPENQPPAKPADS